MITIIIEIPHQSAGRKAMTKTVAVGNCHTLSFYKNVDYKNYFVSCNLQNNVSRLHCLNELLLYTLLMHVA